MKPIISASECASESAGPRPPVLLDVRWQLGGPHGRPDYEAGHLPGAVFVDLDAELARPAGDGGRHPLPDPEEFGAVMRRAGVRGDSSVIVYDGGQGWAAARAWWLLRWTGHRDVRVLDGGLAAWTGELSKETPAPAEGDFVPVPGALPLLDADGAAALARSGLLLDARAAERYRGDVEPIDRVGGHIPGAVSAPTTENVAADGRFLPAERLASRFFDLGAAEGTGEVGVYCGSGVSGAHEVLALEVAGFTGALYAGSWSHWTRDASRPVATGPEPQ
ncbi:MULTISPECIES: sulfurtransferase [unclassified Streptomyces]|uniref:sulfurtransferase n=1 Tax=unclassified Streptomyces TaxID=2593676 RepID=UPI00225108A7|nr:MULTISPECIES: sulfurtransferase [unclassified Streptomyces]MCX5143433.1 sulfurtransferase [Streptomyces sp. NBC_00338]WRZ67849.1 sulfurtransferase [Streptomyces sp. NBC_01257]WSU61836.1 sulfurtransferase [Streptomyces sp. NBC_01104]